MLPFALQRVMEFCRGEHLFVSINKEWRSEYLRQFGRAQTQPASVDTDARREYVAEYWPLMWSLTVANGNKAYTLLPLARMRLSQGSMFKLYAAHLLSNTECETKREYLTSQLIRASPRRAQDVLVICLLYSINAGTVDAVEFFQDHLESLSRPQMMQIFLAVYQRGDATILELMLDRLIDSREAVNMARLTRNSDFIDYVESIRCSRAVESTVFCTSMVMFVSIALITACLL